MKATEQTKYSHLGTIVGLHIKFLNNQPGISKVSYSPLDFPSKRSLNLHAPLRRLFAVIPLLINVFYGDNTSMQLLALYTWLLCPGFEWCNLSFKIYINPLECSLGGHTIHAIITTLLRGFITVHKTYVAFLVCVNTSHLLFSLTACQRHLVFLTRLHGNLWYCVVD